MSKIVFPRKDVLQSLYELTADITPNRFIATNPPAVGEQMRDKMLLNIIKIRNVADTYQIAYGSISVFARDTQNGQVDEVRLDEMQKAVTALFPIRTTLFLATCSESQYGGTDAGFHSLIMPIKIRIHKDFDIHSQD